MTVRALKKKNKMKGPFKLKSGNSPLFKYMGSSPVQKDIPTGRGKPPPSKDEDQIANEKAQSTKKTTKETKKSNVAIGTEKVSLTSPGSGWTKTKGTNIWKYNG
jgi:hypothetical protein